MWPFGRRGESEKAHERSGVGGHEPRLPSSEWASLPPLQRVLSSMDVTVGTDTFQKDLAAQQPPMPFLGPLGHLVSPQAPSGVAKGLTTTVTRRARAREEPPALAPKISGRQRLIRWGRPAWVQRATPGAGDAPDAPHESSPAEHESPSPELESSELESSPPALENASENAPEGERAPISASPEPNPVFEVATPRDLPSAPALPEESRSLVAAPSSVIQPLRLPAFPTQRLSEDAPPSHLPQPAAIPTATPEPPGAEFEPATEESGMGLIGERSPMRSTIPESPPALSNEAARPKTEVDLARPPLQVGGGAVSPSPESATPNAAQSLSIQRYPSLAETSTAPAGPAGPAELGEAGEPGGASGTREPALEEPEENAAAPLTTVAPPTTEIVEEQPAGEHADLLGALPLQRSLDPTGETPSAPSLEADRPGQPGGAPSSVPASDPQPPGGLDPPPSAAPTLGNLELPRRLGLGPPLGSDSGPPAGTGAGLAPVQLSAFPPPASPSTLGRTPLPRQREVAAVPDPPGGALQRSIDPPANAPPTPFRPSPGTAADHGEWTGTAAPERDVESPVQEGGEGELLHGHAETRGDSVPTPAPPASEEAPLIGVQRLTESWLDGEAEDIPDAKASPDRASLPLDTQAPSLSSGPSPSIHSQPPEARERSSPLLDPVPLSVFASPVPLAYEASAIPRGEVSTPVLPTLSGRPLGASVQRLPQEPLSSRARRAPGHPAPLPSSRQAVTPRSSSSALQRQAHRPGDPAPSGPGGAWDAGKEAMGTWGEEAAPRLYGVPPAERQDGPEGYSSRMQRWPAEPSRPSDLPVVSRFEDPAAAALSSGVADRATGGAIIFHPPPGEGAPAPAPPAGPTPTLSLQREGEEPPALAPPASPAPAASSAPAPAPGAPGAPGGDLDELARKLYPKIRPYLKKELWLDRERAGMLTDSGR